MKMRKKLAAVLAAAMIASMMPMTAFAASKNVLNKVINVKEGEDLTTTDAVYLVVEMADGHYFDENDFFEIKLTDAEWPSTAEMKEKFGDLLEFTKDGNKFPAETRATGADYSLYRQSDTTLVVTANTDLSGVIRVPVIAEITGSEPSIAIDGGTSGVSSTAKITFVNSTTGKALVSLGSKVPTIAKKDDVAELIFDEPFAGAFDGGETLRIELRDRTFDMDGTITFEGVKGLAGNVGSISQSGNVLTITLPTTLNRTTSNARGGFILKGLQVKPSRDAQAGEIQAVLSGTLVDRQVITLAKYGDYTTSLKVAKDNYSAVAGKFVDVKFTVSEDMADAIVANRKASFEFSKDIVVDDIVITGKNVKTGTPSQLINQTEWDYVYKVDAKKEKYEKTNIFEIYDFRPDSNRLSSYEIEARLYVPASYKGDITLKVEGKAFADTLEATVAVTEVPLTVEGVGTTLKVGLNQQKTDATITIKETAKHRLTQDNITIAIKDKDVGINFKNAKIEVVEGDLDLDLRYVKYDNGVITIPVKRFSSEPSTIKVSEIVFNVDRTVPEGAYAVDVGGSAISNEKTIEESRSTTTVKYGGQGIGNKVDTLKEFIVIGTPNTEDITDSINKAKVQFVIGASQYLVDGVEHTMDAAAYAKDGRTMVPVRYVAAALGITGDRVVWDGPNQAVTIIADKTIQVKLGSKMMLIDGVSVPMSAAAEAVSGRVFVPVAEIARGLGVTVAWDSATQTATFN